MEAVPVLHQFPLMERSGFENHRRRAVRKRAIENRDRFDSDLIFIPAINGMDVRRIVVVEIHTNHDAKKRRSRAFAHILTISAATVRWTAVASIPNQAHLARIVCRAFGYGRLFQIVVLGVEPPDQLVQLH